jgi:hypothetical protein
MKPVREFEESDREIKREQLPRVEGIDPPRELEVNVR